MTPVKNTYTDPNSLNSSPLYTPDKESRDQDEAIERLVEVILGKNKNKNPLEESIGSLKKSHSFCVTQEELTK